MGNIYDYKNDKRDWLKARRNAKPHFLRSEMVALLREIANDGQFRFGIEKIGEKYDKKFDDIKKCYEAVEGFIREYENSYETNAEPDAEEGLDSFMVIDGDHVALVSSNTDESKDLILFGEILKDLKGQILDEILRYGTFIRKKKIILKILESNAMVVC